MSASGAAAVVAPEPSGERAGSRALLGVTLGELRDALQLSLICAVTAALLAAPAGAVEFVINDEL